MDCMQAYEVFLGKGGLNYFDNFWYIQTANTVYLKKYMQYALFCCGDIIIS